MTFRIKIFLAFLLIGIIGFSELYRWGTKDLKPGYRKATEEPLSDISNLLATIVETTTNTGQLDLRYFKEMSESLLSRRFHASIFDYVKESIDLRIYVTDQAGRVIYDSKTPPDIGADYSGWRDVKLSLSGEYGARTSNEGGDGKSVMYVSAPIRIGGEIKASVSVGKPTDRANVFVSQARQNVFFGVLVAIGAFSLVGLLLSRVISLPIERLTKYAREVRDGKRTTLPELGSGEVRILGEAFEEMRDALEGKLYIERYVETLTHELKSPLAAISGATELLGKNLSQEKVSQLLSNIGSETLRMQSVVEQLLLLSSLEARKELSEPKTLDMRLIAQEVSDELKHFLEHRGVVIELHLSANPLFVKGDHNLLSEAVRNLLQNAGEFAVRGSSILVSTLRVDLNVELTVRNTGPAIPDYALTRIFERFYSLPRPDTGKKSSGLGLSIVREIATLHSGNVRLENIDSAGVIGILTIPSTK